MGEAQFPKDVGELVLNVQLEGTLALAAQLPLYVWMYVCLYVCVSVYVCGVCIYIYIYTHTSGLVCMSM